VENDAIEGGAEGQPPPASARADEAAATLMVKAAAQTGSNGSGSDALDTGSLSGGPDGKASDHLGHPPRCIPGANMRLVCVAADGPNAMRHPTGACSRRIFRPGGRKRSLNICLLRPVGYALK
jgi:hypothetical protein